MRFVMLLWVAIATVGFAEQSQPPTPSSGDSVQHPDTVANESKHITCCDKTGTAETPFVVKTVTGPKTQEATEQEKRERDEKSPSDWWVSGSTVWISIVTTLLAIYTWRLWKSTSDIAEGAEKTAKRQLRAYVAITECQSAPSNTHWVVVGRFKNVGQTPAFNVRLRGDVFISKYPLAEIPKLDFSIKDLTKTVLFPTEDLPYYEVGKERPPAPDYSKPPTPDMHPFAAGSNNALWLIVEVRYFDTFGVEHFTRRCIHSGNVIAAINNFEILHTHYDGNDAD